MMEWWKLALVTRGEHLVFVIVCDVLHCLCRVLTRVTCDVIVPKAHRPREGVLYFQVELTPLASPLFDIGSK